MSKIIKLSLCAILSICLVFSIGSSKISKNTKVLADNNLVAITDDNGNTVKYRNSSEAIMRLENYNYPTQNLRACWVSNFISSLPSYSTEAKWKSDFSHVLDVMETYGLNCIIFHVRTHNNALYKSELNPVATFFKNVNFDEFDPLEWAIEETHRRGIEFHAWLNPYRVLDSYCAEDYPEGNPANDSSNLLSNGSGTILNPGIKSNRDFIVDTCMEVVENYDVDAIHFDDYFYISGVETSKSGDWKREQVNLFIEDLSNTLRKYNKENNKTVQLGISPSGIYRNGSSSSTPKYDSNGNLTSPLYSNTSGFAHYDDYLYSDTLKWINEEWIDYIMPQTYWALEQTAASYGELSKWWSWAVKYKKVNLYLGIGFYMADPSQNNSYWQKNSNEIRDQILNAEMYDEIGGISLYSYNYIESTNTTIKNGMNLMKNDFFKTKIPCDVKKYYAPLYDTVEVENINIENNVISYDECENVRGYVVYKVKNNEQVNQEDINQVYYYGTDLSVDLDDTTNYTYYVSSVNLANEISTPKTFEVIEEPVDETPKLNIYKKNISYSSNTYIMYAVEAKNIDNTVPVKMLFWNDVQTEYLKGTQSYEKSSSGNTTINDVYCKVFSSNGIAAKEMTDEIYARAYVEIDGEIIYSDVIKYSVLEYYYDMKQAGTASTNLSNLLDAMIYYGAMAQINFKYNTDRLANGTYYKVSLINGTLHDGFSYGLYQKDELITLTANEVSGKVFKHWIDSNNNIISTNKLVQINVNNSITYEAIYTENSNVTLEAKYSVDVEYNTESKDIDTPNYLIVNNGVSKEQVSVSWDLSGYDKTVEGIQTFYGTLVDSNYTLDKPITLEINVMPYTLYYDNENNEYTITEYHGSSNSVTVPSKFNDTKVVAISDSTFYNCTNLESITISEGITTIGAYAFQNCTNVKDFILPSSLEYIGTYAFSMCNAFENLYYNGTVESWCNITFASLYANPLYYDEYFYMKGTNNEWTLVTEIVIPETITVINDYQFAYLGSLQSVTLSSNLTSIGESAFRSCQKISTIILPTTLTTIKDYAFYYCAGLKTVYNLSKLSLTKASNDYGYVAKYASYIYTSL